MEGKTQGYPLVFSNNNTCCFYTKLSRSMSMCLKKGRNGPDRRGLRAAVRRYRETCSASSTETRRPSSLTPNMSHRPGVSHTEEHSGFRSAQSEPRTSTRCKGSSRLSCAWQGRLRAQSGASKPVSIWDPFELQVSAPGSGQSQYQSRLGVKG